MRVVAADTAMTPPALRPLAATLAALVALATIVAATSVDYKNDAGSGTDAPGMEATALNLSTYGAYSGYIMPDDTDWYKLDAAAGPSCVALRISGDVPVNATFVVVQDSVRRTAQAPITTSNTVLAFATPGVSSVRLGVTSPATGYYPHGGYVFDFNATTGGAVGDAGTGADAPGSLSAAVPIAPGCIDGDISPTTGLTGDTQDAYAFQAKAGDVGVFSLATSLGVPVTLQITDGTNVLATIVSGGVAQVSFPTSGPFYMTAASSSLTATGSMEYLVGIILGPPDPCSPMC